MTILKKQRKANKNLIFLDNGGLFPPPNLWDQKLYASIGLDVLNYMELDAMNLGQREFYFGTQYLAEQAKKVSFPFISTNIQTVEKLPWLKKYIIKEIDGNRIAILGILPETAFSYYVNPKLVQGLFIVNPEKAIKGALAEIGDQADIIILLSQLPLEKTKALIEKIPAINFAVAKSKKNECEMTVNPDQLVAPSSASGRYYLSADIAVAKDGKVTVTQTDSIDLGNSIAHTAAIDSMIEAPLKERRKTRENAMQASKEQLQQGNSIQPQIYGKDEFFKKINEEKAKLKQMRPTQEGEEINATLLFDGQKVPATIRVIHSSNGDVTSQGSQDSPGKDGVKK